MSAGITKFPAKADLIAAIEKMIEIDNTAQSIFRAFGAELSCWHGCSNDGRHGVQVTGLQVAGYAYDFPICSEHDPLRTLLSRLKEACTYAEAVHAFSHISGDSLAIWEKNGTFIPRTSFCYNRADLDKEWL